MVKLEERVAKLEKDAVDTNELLSELRTSFDRLNDTVHELGTSLVAALTGVNKVDVTTMNKIVLILGLVIASLLFVVVFLLTGEKIALPNIF